MDGRIWLFLGGKTKKSKGQNHPLFQLTSSLICQFPLQSINTCFQVLPLPCVNTALCCCTGRCVEEDDDSEYCSVITSSMVTWPGLADISVCALRGGFALQRGKAGWG